MSLEIGELAEMLATIKSVFNLSGSPSENLLAFNWNRDGKWDVYIYDLSLERIEKITSGPDSYLEPSFSNRRRLIAYLKDREGDEMYQVILRDLESGEEQDLTRDPSHYHFNPRFDPRDEMIAFTSNRGGRPSQLFLWRDHEILELTRWNEPIFNFNWVSEREIVYIRGIYDTELRLIDVENLSDELLLKFEGSEIYLGDVNRSRKKILFTSNKNGYLDIGEYDLDERTWKWIYRSNSEKYSPRYYFDDILFIEFTDGRNILKKIRREEIEILATGVVEFEVFRGGIAYVRSTSDEPSSLYVNNKLVIDNTPGGLKGRLVKAYSDYYTTYDGRRIHAMIYKPDNWNKTAVVHVHGGPDAHSMDSWNPISQLLALNGFMVIQPNYRGSTGFGREFQHLNDRDLGGGDLQDVIHAAKHAKDLGAEKIVIIGASYGGYLTALALVKAPEIWDAGVAIVGFYNWYTEYENEADYLKSYDSIKMDPKLFRERSPIFFVENIRAPVLFIHGEKDPRCPVEEVYQMIEVLNKLGKKVEHLIFPDEGHGVRKDENRIKMYKRIIEFLNKYLTGRVE
ncbi:MAG: S9 family peptidase [Sulfolobales archaeon]